MIRGLLAIGVMMSVLFQFQVDGQVFTVKESTPYPTWGLTQQAIYRADSIEAFERFIQHDGTCQWPCISGLTVGESNRNEILTRLKSPGFDLFLENSSDLGSDSFYDSYYAYGGALQLVLTYNANGVLESVDLVASEWDTSDWITLLSTETSILSFRSILETIQEQPEIYVSGNNVPDDYWLSLVFPETGMHIDGTFKLDWDGETAVWTQNTPLCFGIDHMTYFRAEIRNLQPGERFDYEPEPSSRIRLIDEYDFLPTSAEFEDMLLAAGDDGCLPLMGNRPMTPTRTPNVTPTATP